VLAVAIVPCCKCGYTGD